MVGKIFSRIGIVVNDKYIIPFDTRLIKTIWSKNQQKYHSFETLQQGPCSIQKNTDKIFRSVKKMTFTAKSWTESVETD